jgi:hypothetical protein
MKTPNSVTVRISLTNDAFQDGNSGSEAARILRDLADRIDGSELTKNDCRFARDINGNRVGELKTSKQ